jgi:hypothetical protein
MQASTHSAAPWLASQTWHAAQLPPQGSAGTQTSPWQVEPAPQLSTQTGLAPVVSQLWQAPQAGLQLGAGSGSHSPLLLLQWVPAPQLSTQTGLAPVVSQVWHAAQAGLQDGAGSGSQAPLTQLVPSPHRSTQSGLAPVVSHI